MPSAAGRAGGAHRLKSQRVTRRQAPIITPPAPVPARRAANERASSSPFRTPDRIDAPRPLTPQSTDKGTHLVDTFARLLVEPLNELIGAPVSVRPSGGGLSLAATRALRETRDQDVVIVTHAKPLPDVDAIASAVGTAKIIADHQRATGGTGSVRVFVPGRIPIRVSQWLHPELASLIVSDFDALGLEGRTQPFTSMIVDAADRHQLGEGGRLFDHPANTRVLGFDHHGVSFRREDLGIGPEVELVDGSDGNAAATSAIVLDIAEALGTEMDGESPVWRSMAEMWAAALRMDDPSMKYGRGLELARWLVNSVLGGDTAGIRAKVRSGLPPAALGLLAGDDVPYVSKLLVAQGLLAPGERTRIVGLDDATLIVCPRSVQEAALHAARSDLGGAATSPADKSDCHGVLFDMLDAFATLRAVSALLLEEPGSVRVSIRSPSHALAGELAELLPGVGGGDPCRAAKTLHGVSLAEAEALVRDRIGVLLSPLGV